jgi:hypothetical protein
MIISANYEIIRVYEEAFSSFFYLQKAQNKLD